MSLTIFCFGSLMNIDKLILLTNNKDKNIGFGSLMNIDKLILLFPVTAAMSGFGFLMNIDKLIPSHQLFRMNLVLVL